MDGPTFPLMGRTFLTKKQHPQCLLGLQPAPAPRPAGPETGLGSLEGGKPVLMPAAGHCRAHAP